MSYCVECGCWNPCRHSNRTHSAGRSRRERYVPTTLRLALLDSIHTSPESGHPGSQRTLSLLRNRYWWPSMARDVARYVRGCSVCAITTTPHRLTESKLVPLPIPRRPWSHIGIDFATDLPPSSGFTTIFVIVDRFSKACKLIPLRGLPTALEAAEALFQHVFQNVGLPEDIVLDRGPQFISRVWRGFFCLLGVSVSLSSGYHPQTNGQTEHKIQEIGRYLRAYCHQHLDSWSQYLPWAEYAQNSLRQETTGLTPFQCVLGFQPPLFPWTGEPSEVPAVDHWFRESEREWDSAHVHLQRAVRRHKDYADARRTTTPVYQPGDQVWLSTRDIRLRLPCRKLRPRYVGPFPITRQINEVTYELQLPNTYRISPTFHVSLLKPLINPLLPPSTEHEIPPPPEVDPNETIYRVQEILDSRQRGGRLQYLVDWEGYGPKERSWVDRDDVLDPSLLSDFHQSHPERPAPRGRGRPCRRSRAPRDARGGGGYCHRLTNHISHTNHLYSFTVTWLLITYTWFHLPQHYISLLTSVPRRLVSRLHAFSHALTHLSGSLWFRVSCLLLAFPEKDWDKDDYSSVWWTSVKLLSWFPHWMSSFSWC